jgi:hypothetical protein
MAGNMAAVKAYQQQFADRYIDAFSVPIQQAPDSESPQRNDNVAFAVR